MSNRCFHCDELVPSDFDANVEFDGSAQPVCCLGCEAVMQAIIEAGLGNYYRHRAGPAVLGQLPEALAAELGSFAVFDEPECADDYLDAIDERRRELVLTVEHIRCGACVWLLERSLLALDGVYFASVNFASARAVVRFDVDRIAVSEILTRVAERGFNALPFAAKERVSHLNYTSRRMLQRLFVAGIGSMQVMMYALPQYLSAEGEVEAVFAELLDWAAFALTVPVLLFSASPFFAGALASLRRRSVGMDVPVSLALVLTTLASVYSLLTGSGESYFDSISMFVFLLLVARYVEWTARSKALWAADVAGASLPEMATRLRQAGDGKADRTEERVPALRLQVGDRIRVGSGDRVPVDALVLSGRGAVDCSVLTGESVPVEVGTGSVVPGGALVCDCPLELEVNKVQRESTLSLIGKLVERGASEKPAWVAFADHIAVYFVTLVLAITAAVFAAWLWVDPSRAPEIAISVLVVACPCALSLATPAALAAGTGKLLSLRILATRGHVLHRMAEVTDIVFDKTGTLTTGAPELAGIRCARGEDEVELLALAAEMERGSAHPFARALIRAAAHAVAVPHLVKCEHRIGYGVEARLQDGARVRLGSAHWCGLTEKEVATWQVAQGEDGFGVSELYLSRYACDSAHNGTVLARFVLVDRLQSDAHRVVRALQEKGIGLHVVSGDQAPAVAGVAAALGISNWVASASPEDKQAYVSALQSRGGAVLMVGDGVNDAPVLASADVSMAVDRATDLARNAADVVTLQRGLGSVLILKQLAERTASIIKQNLAWACLYNISAIPAAAMGWVPPWLAAIGMALSSMLVACNALRLWRSPRVKSRATYADAEPMDVSWSH